MTARVDRILAAHPHSCSSDISIILIHYYRLEWTLPGATLGEVQNTLEHITQGLVDAPNGTIEIFADAIKKGEL